MIHQNKREEKEGQDSVNSIRISGTSSYDFTFIDAISIYSTPPHTHLNVVLQKMCKQLSLTNVLQSKCQEKLPLASRAVPVLTEK